MSYSDCESGNNLKYRFDIQSLDPTSKNITTFFHMLFFLTFSKISCITYNQIFFFSMRQGGISSRGFYPETQSSVFFLLIYHYHYLLIINKIFFYLIFIINSIKGQDERIFHKKMAPFDYEYSTIQFT